MNLKGALAHSKRAPTWLRQMLNLLIAQLAVILGLQLDSVATIAALESVDDLRIPDGSKKVVRTLQDTWTLDKTSTDVADGITIIATSSGTGRWVRDLQPNAVWSRQATWYVDAVTGNDENAGAVATPLATFSEFRRRVEGGPIAVESTIHILSDLPATDPLGVLSAGENVRVTGTATTVYNGTVSLVTPRTGTQGLLVRDAAWTVADHLQRRIRFTSGAADGLWAWIMSDEGANDARITNVTDSDGWPTTAPGIGDTFVVETLSEVTFDLRQVYGGGFYYTDLQSAVLSNWILGNTGGDIFFVGCGQLTVIPFHGTVVLGNCLCGSVRGYGGNFYLKGGVSGKILVEECSYAGVINSYYTIDVQLAPWVGEGVEVSNNSVFVVTADLDMFGDFGPDAMLIRGYSSVSISDGINWGGDITGTTNQGGIHEGSALRTTSFAHTIIGFTQGFWLYPDGVEVAINDGPITLPGSLTQVGVGANSGTSGPMRAGVTGALFLGTRYALPDWTESATADMPQMVAGKSVARNLRGQLVTAPGGADTVVVSVYINGIISALVMTFTGAELVAEDTTNNIIVNPGDVISFHVVKSGALAADLTIALEVG